MQTVITWLTAHWAALTTALFFLSEALAVIPGIKANSVFQLIFGFLQSEQPKA